VQPYFNSAVFNLLLLKGVQQDFKLLAVYGLGIGNFKSLFLESEWQYLNCGVMV